MQSQDRLTRCRKWLDAHECDALIVPSNDPHFSEYVAAHWQCRQWISGFRGSAGTAVITKDKAIVSVDSRYFVQADQQLDDGFDVLQQRVAHTPEHLDWIEEQLPTKSTVAVNGWLCAVTDFEEISTRLGRNRIALRAVSDPFLDLWQERPDLPKTELYDLDLKYCGVSRADKLDRLRDSVSDGSFLVTALDDIAWLLNVRGSDVQYSPIFYAWLLVEASGAILCCDSSIPARLRDSLKDDGVTVRPYAAIIDLLSAGTRILRADASRLPQSFSRLAKFTPLTSPIPPMKAVKNPVEIENLKQAMLKDAIALQAFFDWLKSAQKRPPDKGLTEWDCVQQINTLRTQQQGYLGPSFASIVGTGGNAACAHYEPTEKQCLKLQPDVLLVDTGAHYWEGTTDTTRTICLGEPTAEQQAQYTCVLKGLIALSEAEFPRGTTGHQLEVLARQPLWKQGLNYGHGTGHGVGYLLNVHEVPPSFGSAANATPVALQPGMVMTIEPGHYVTGSHGIRIENMVLVVEAEHEGFLKFETLTLLPIDTQMVDETLLDDHERDWLAQFNSRCREELQRRRLTSSKP